MRVPIEKQQYNFCDSYNITNSKKYNLWICSKHRRQLDLYGRTKERTIFDKNVIIIENNYTKILMYHKNYEVIVQAIIDIDDIPKISRYKWNISKGYVITKQGTFHIKLHRLIMKDVLKDGKEINHINWNKLNNRKSNLRVVTHSENMNNLSISSRNTSDIKGIYYIKLKSQYRVNYENKDLSCAKYFRTLKEFINFKESIS